MTRTRNWRPVVGYENRYLVSDDGDIFSLNLLALMKPGRDEATGYLKVRLADEHGGATRSVHKLVAAAFIGPANGLEVRHLDGNRLNNNLWNFAYGTKSENMQDMVRHGTRTYANAEKTHCAHGHEFNLENTQYWVRAETGKTRRRCRICSLAAARRYEAKKKAALTQARNGEER